MTSKKYSVLKYTYVLAIILTIVFFAPFSASAQTDNAELQGQIDSIKGEIEMPPSQYVLTAASVRGLPPCVVIANNGSCGMVATQAGKFDKGDISYSSGDVIKCYNSVLELTSCAVSNSKGTSFSSSRYTTAVVSTDRQGKIIGSSATTLQGEAAQAVADAAVEGAQSSFTGVVTDAVSDIGTVVITAAGTAVLTIANLLLGIAGTLLNFVVVKTVFEFGSVIGNSPGILVAWGIFRDLGNLVLLFGFIFMGLAMILNLNTFSAQKAIPRLLIFAILMNFSLFAAEAVIDTTNAVSSVIYSQANGDNYCLQDIAGVPITAQGLGLTEQSDVTAVNALNDCAVNYGIAGQIMQSTGLSTMWKVNDAGFGATTATYIGLALFATIGAVVLFAAAIMLSIRLIVLTFLMVTAPIGFAGMAIPPLQKYAKMWWDKLISQSIFAPVLFLLIFVSLKITDSFVGTTSAGAAEELSLAQALTQPNASIMGIILVFVLVIGFMVASLVAAKSIGAQGASGAINLGTKIARGTFGGIGGVAGRNTIGRGSASFQKGYEKFLGKSPRLRSALITTGLDSAIAGAAKKGQDAKFGGSTSFKEKKEKKEARDKELKRIGNAAIAQDKVKNARNDAEATAALKSLSEAETKELDEIKKGTGQLELIAKNLSPEMFDKIMNDKDIPDERKEKLRDARFAEINEVATRAKSAADALATNPLDPTLKANYDAAKKDLAKATGKLTNKDIAQLSLSSKNASVLENEEFVETLSDDQFKDFKKNDKISDTQRSDLEGRRNDRLNNPARVAARISTMTSEEIGKLKGDVLTNPTVLGALSGRQLIQIEPNKLSGGDLSKVATYIRSQANTLPPTAIGSEFNAYYASNPRFEQLWKVPLGR